MSSSTYATEVLSESPAIYYRLNESSGTTAADSSGNGRNATYSAGVTLGVDGALANEEDPAVNVTNAEVNFTAGTGLPTGNASRTVEAWIKTTVGGQPLDIASYGTASSVRRRHHICTLRVRL